MFALKKNKLNSKHTNLFKDFTMYNTLLLTLIFLMISSCSSSFSKMQKLGEYTNLVLYRLPAAEYPERKEIKAVLPPMKEFPAMTPQKILDVLGNISYEKVGVWGSEKNRVFYEQELKYIAPLLSQYLKFLGDKDRLVLVSRFDPDNSVLSRMERVTALIWMDEAGLNIVFGEIRKKLIQDDMTSKDDEWKYILPISLYRSYQDLRITDADFYTKKEVAGRIHESWIIIPEDKMKSISYLPPVNESDAKVEKSEDLTRRLQELQKAKDQGLLTEEEYKEKRKLIISNY